MAFEPLTKGTQVNGVSFPAEFLTKNMDFFTLRTTLDITPDGNEDPTDTAQQRLDKVVETVSLRAQPIILGEIVSEGETGPVSDLPATAGLGTGTSVTVYTLRFAIEHADAWPSADDLASALNGLDTRNTSTGAESGNPFVYDSVDTSNNNVAVYVNEFLSKSRT